MHILIFITYLIVFSFIITRMPFFKGALLPPMLLVLLFITKVAVGCAYGWIHTLKPDYLTTMDTWKFYTDGLKEMEVLKHNTWFFFSELTNDPYNDGYGKILGTTNSYWNDLKYNVMIKLAGVFNFFSGGNYYTNVIFYSAISFVGPVALFRLLKQMFGSSNLKLIIICFGIPSVVFWTSGFHKEGLLFSAIGLILYYSYQIFKSGFSIAGAAIIFLSFISIFILRNNLLLGLLPAWLFWMISEYFRSYARTIFILGSIIFVTLFFSAGYIHPRLNLPMYVSGRQKEFMLLGGNTLVATETIEPGVTGFIKHLPTAVNMGFLRPHIGEGGLFYIPFTVEILALLSCFILLMVYRKSLLPSQPFLYFSLFFAVVTCLMIGYTITNTGATIRYRSLALPFLLLFMLMKFPSNLLKGLTNRFDI